MITERPCSHTISTTIRTRAYSGPVSRDENPAASGNVTHTDECSSCGARREINVNGRHHDEGPWGPSRDQRLAEANRRVADAARALARAPAPTPIDRDGIRASVDDAGYVVLTGPGHDTPDTAEGLPAEWVAAAVARREAARALDAARAELEDELR